MARPPMSMEAVLDEERREVLALLEDRPAQVRRALGAAGGARSPSPFSIPRSPVRSMLDLGVEVPPPSTGATGPGSSGMRSPVSSSAVRSMLDLDSSPPPVRSMLDVDSPPHSASKQTFSARNSPTEANYKAHAANNTAHHRSMSDAASKPADFGPRAAQTRVDPTSEFQFSDIITSQQGPVLPKRVLQGGKRATNAMAEIMRGGPDMGSLVLPGAGNRHYSGARAIHGSSQKSKSPHNRLGMRSNSPHILIAGRPLSPSGRALLDETQALDMNNAYRRLSDAHLARSRGSLSGLPLRKRSDDTASMGRLQKDYISPDGDLLVEDSSDDRDDQDDGSSSDDESERGRKTARSFPENNGHSKGPGSDSGQKEGRKTLSLLAAAEEERMFPIEDPQEEENVARLLISVTGLHVAATQPYRSLLDEPQIQITSPSGEKVKPGKAVVHPSTSFDQSSRSGSRTPLDSDEEAEYTDIKRAQKLSFSMTPIMSHSDSHRAIRIIYRGEYVKVQQDAEENHRRLRKYLVATDLSDESTHALEWTIGTVLRDGDTMIAIYCVDEETGIVGPNALVPDEPKAMREQAAAINAMTSSRANSLVPTSSVQYQPSPLGRALELSHVSSSPSRERTKADEERFRAVQDITDRVTKLLRKTRLQVRVIVEVLHCKNPKHLITEVIDLVNPTLVILGSRGRSALKG